MQARTVYVREDKGTQRITKKYAYTYAWLFKNVAEFGWSTEAGRLLAAGRLVEACRLLAGGLVVEAGRLLAAGRLVEECRLEVVLRGIHVVFIVLPSQSKEVELLVLFFGAKWPLPIALCPSIR